MKRISIIVFVLLMIPLVSFSKIYLPQTYYVHNDGTAANKAAATGPCETLANCMSPLVYITEILYSRDTVYFCQTPTPSIPGKMGFYNFIDINKISSCSVMTGTAGAATLTVGLSNCYTFEVTDDEDTTITASDTGTAGDEITIIFLTAGTANEVITFEPTLIDSTGTLTLGTTADVFYEIKFVSDGSKWVEVGRYNVQF